MAKVVGIGGIFLKCKNKEALGTWYAKYLGMSLNKYCGFELPLKEAPATAYNVLGLFQSDTEYFNPSNKAFMINLMVDDVDAALEQVVAGGAELSGKIEDYDYGRFGWFIDPEGNKIELWQPK